jgi:hypothetical protein
VGREIFTAEPRVTTVPIEWDEVVDMNVVPALEGENSHSIGVE